MSEELYVKSYGIVCEALNLEGEKREAFVNEECGDDHALRQEVEELLVHIPQAHTECFLECESFEFPVDEVPDEFLGQQINEYEIVEYIGRGGQGDVYKAVSTGDIKRKVAIKILRTWLNSDEIVRRFQKEIQIYESLGEHPNIAHVYDAGKTANDRPYFIMEYVDGQPIHDYCDKKNLSLRERTELILIVFEALKHAHGRLVIHRDIKPDNILVTRDGIPKLLDFGIAKLLEAGLHGAENAETMTARLALTIPFASPEQVEGHQILGIATDVYSSGVVLYRLLTGHRPYETEGQTFTEQRRVICEEPPISPEKVIAQSTKGNSRTEGERTLIHEDVAKRRGISYRQLRRELSTDIKTILLHALRKEPEKRYRSIGEFSVDLKCWLNEQPLQYADRVGRFERSVYWIRRNRATTLAMAMSGMLIVMGALLWIEKEERRNALLLSTQFDAREVALRVELELADLEWELEKAGDSPELRKYLRENDREGLHEYVSGLVERLKMSGKTLLFESWAIYDPSGTMIAHSLTQKYLGEPFDYRDYMKGALREAGNSGGTPVYISHIYRSKTQGYFKFSMARAVRDIEGSGEIIGVITTSLTTSRAMGLPRIAEDPREIVLVGPWDDHPDEAAGEPDFDTKFLIFLHPSYPLVEEIRRGEPAADPIEFPEELAHFLRGGVFPEYRDPAASMYGDYEGNWLAASAPVEGTEFVVIVQVKPEP